MTLTRVLFIDDDWLSRKIYAETLEEDGCEIVTLGSAVEALDLLERQRFDVIISDLIMREIDGIEFINRVGQRYPNQPVILLTAHASADAAVAAIKAGASDFLVKPVNPELLRLAIRQSRETRRALDENKQLARYVHLYESSRRVLLCVSLDRLREVALDELLAAAHATAGWVVNVRPDAEPNILVRGFSETANARLLSLTDDLRAAVTADSDGLRIEPKATAWIQSAVPTLVPFQRVVLVRCDVGQEPVLLFVMLAGTGDKDAFSGEEIADLQFLRARIGRSFELCEKFGATERSAYTDDLTKLYNSRYLDLVVDREILRASVDVPHVFSLLLIDVDHFKALNDSQGHIHGSRVLIELSRVLQRAFREFDLVFRLGGDEFVVYLHECGGPDAVCIAERIRQRIANHCFLAREALNLSITASIGVAAFPLNSSSRSALLQHLESAVRTGKQTTRNSVFRGEPAAPLS